MSVHERSDGTEDVKEISEQATLQFLSAAAAALPSRGTLVSDGRNLLRWEAETIGPTDQITFRLVLSDQLWAWKTMPIRTHIGGVWAGVRELGVNSNQRISTVNLHYNDLGNMIMLDFWKHGFLGLGAWVTATTLSVAQHLGKRITFIWEQDS